MVAFFGLKSDKGYRASSFYRYIGLDASKGNLSLGIDVTVLVRGYDDLGDKYYSRSKYVSRSSRL